MQKISYEHVRLEAKKEQKKEMNAITIIYSLGKNRVQSLLLRPHIIYGVRNALMLEWANLKRAQQIGLIYMIFEFLGSF